MTKFTSSRFYVFFVILLNELLVAKARSRPVTEASCDKIISQNHYSLKEMTGTWYGIEIIEHVTRGRATVDSCIKVELIDRDQNHVNLIWREKNFEVTYKFVMDNKERLGIWTSQDYQHVNGKPDGYVYEQFAGKVFVMKASGDDVVLTFCSVPSKLFTLVLSKTYMMNETELESIHNLVKRLGALEQVDKKKYCKNNSIGIESGILIILLSIITVFIFKLSL